MLIEKSKRKEKPKKKAKRHPDIECVTHHPLESCVDRLRELSGWDRVFIKTRVKLWQLDEDTWNFGVYRSHYISAGVRRQYWRGGVWYLKIQVSGQLSRTTPNSTVVIGNASTHYKTYIVNGIWLAIFGPGLLILTVSFLFFTGLDCISLTFLATLSALVFLSTLLPKSIGKEYASRMAQEVRNVLLY
jgi:hypothetical protein